MLELRIRACHVYGSFVAGDNARAAFTLKDALEKPARDANRIVLPPASYLQEREKVEKRFEEIGFQLMNRASGDFQHDATASVLGDPTKRRLAAQTIGQAYINAYNMVLQNREGVEKIADTVVARRELYGDELVDLLNSAGLKEPDIDLTKEESWPTL